MLAGRQRSGKLHSVSSRDALRVVRGHCSGRSDKSKDCKILYAFAWID